MKYFTKQEFEKSNTATKLKIDNSIPDNLTSGLEELVNNLLDPLREAWGTGIRVTSGYRCPQLNEAIKGSKTSSHCYALAADIQPVGRDIERFKEFVKDFLYARDFDQVIWESNGSSYWIHISYKNKDGKQRKQYLQSQNNKLIEWT